MKGSSSSLSVLKILCIHANEEFVAILLNTYLACPLVEILHAPLKEASGCRELVMQHIFIM